jgi:hypothetical protein
MDEFGPIRWIVWAGAAWIALTLLLSVFWGRLKRAEPKVTKEDEVTP